MPCIVIIRTRPVAEIIHALSAGSILPVISCASAGETAKAKPIVAALASAASGQRGHSFIVRAHSATKDARKRAGDTRRELGSSARAAMADAIRPVSRVIVYPLTLAALDGRKSSKSVAAARIR